MSYFSRLRGTGALPAQFIFSGAVVMGGFFIVNVLNYLFTLIISRILSVAEFGEVTAIFSLLIIVSVPSAALTMLLANEVAFERGGGRDHMLPHLISFVRRHVLLAGACMWLTALALSPLISHVLHIALPPILIFTLLVPLSLYGAVQSGAFQGLQEFFALSSQNILSTLVKLFGSLLLIHEGFSVAGVISALVLASVAAILFGTVLLRGKMINAGNTENLEVATVELKRRMRASIGILLTTTLLLALLSNVDVLLAKHYLSSADAGLYSALSTIGKILVYGIGAFITVLLPMASEAHARNGNPARIMLISLSIIALSSALVCTVFFTAPLLAVHLLFGARYDAIAGYLGIFSIGMAAVALSTAFINYFIAIRDKVFVALFALGLVLETALLFAYHDSIGTFVHVLVISWVLLFVVLALRFGWFYVKKGHEQDNLDNRSGS